ncbi:translation protein SH3-like domain-containing protein [Endogone sp. FLAS-F59071]|nr:translation protein SH3-like domain-containing protein [Endogone sp. FLAS-F59071]|eukprot:RUS23216.1 translation protein SH3-like domain-containing protein [Endogone sp. FLAS-F59071]
MFLRKHFSALFAQSSQSYTPPPSVIVPSPQYPAPVVKKHNLIQLITDEQIRRLNTDGRTLLFSRKNPDRVRPGSILLVENVTSLSKGTISTFMGVVIAIRRKGIDTNFTLRNIVMKVGVEQRFSLYSPMLKSIKVLQRPTKMKFRRAKLYYLRDQPEKVFQPLQALRKQEQSEKVALADAKAQK